MNDMRKVTGEKLNSNNNNRHSKVSQNIKWKLLQELTDKNMT